MSCDRKISDERFASTKVLVVNDDHGAIRFILSLLSAMGFRNIYHAANGATGLDLIRAKAPDIIVLDWDMGLDGQRFLQTVRKFLMKSLSLRPLEECLAAVIEVANEPWRAVLSG